MKSLVAPEARSWWGESIKTVLDGASVLDGAAGPLELETRTAQLIGGELCARLERESRGFDLAEWLDALVDAAIAAMKEGGADPTPALLLRGISTMAAREHTRPVLNALKKNKPAGISTRATAEPNGDLLTAHDAYGGRWLLVAPFSYGAEVVDRHFYAWDVDACTWPKVTAAGAFGSAEAALTEWRAAVGHPAADAVLSDCRETPVAAELLARCVRTDRWLTPLEGTEPRELLVEYYRLRGRGEKVAAALKARVGGRPDGEAVAEVAREFIAWHRGRHGEVEPEAVTTLADEWLTSDHVALRHVCSPHRVALVITYLRDMYIPEYADEMLALLPAWVEWCAERSGLPADLAEKALATARSGQGLPDDHPFRLAE